ncbi:MAG: hypothetical protein KBA40_02275 [Candidatus Peribacteraceae bacterium]|nr:hypothetical protein [Candidatus Peribacteraceae bacterium]MBP9850989.1 hypothetical protein [Candidatus Peribacteraceae bacterium]
MSSSLKLRSLQKQHEEVSRATEPRVPTAREMWAVTLTCFWFLSGLFIDGWAHIHRPELESFFTPWHAVFYSGYAATALTLLLIIWLARKRQGGTFMESIPHGFGYALIGAAVFAIGGVGDMAWHELFGVEANIEALLSPTHLVLAVSMGLMLSTGLRVWCKTTPPIGVPNFLTQLPMLLSGAMTLSLIWFMTNFSHFIIPRASSLPPEDPIVADMSQNIAITGYLFHIAVITGVILFIARRARIATGGFTTIFTLSILEMALMRDGLAFVPAGFATGVLADILARRLHPFELHRREVRMFAFIIPAAFFTAYFLTLSLTSGIWWTVHLWTGSIVMSGLTGLLVSFLVLPLKEWDEK